MLPRLLLLLAALVPVTGCGVNELPPPAQPERIVPNVPDPRATPVSAGAGRVVLDAVGGPAEVSRVTSTAEISLVQYGRSGTTRLPAEQRQTELLCITPCVVDLPIGAHELVFRKPMVPGVPASERPSSTAVVAIHDGQPLVVRHAVGHENVSVRVAYALGFVALGLGVGLTAMSAATFGVAGSSGRGHASGAFYAIGSVTGGLGLTLDVVGILALVRNRPVHQDGATTTWRF